MKSFAPSPRFAWLLPLVTACAASRVDQPPPPPAFEPGTQAAPAPKVETPSAPAVGALAAPSPPAKRPDPSEPAADVPPEREDPPLGWIAGEPLQAEELLLEWGDVSSREMWLVLDKIVAARLALAEAGRLGIRLSPEAVDARYAVEHEKLVREVTRNPRKPSLEEFIAGELGFDPGRFLDRVRRSTVRQMLAERAVRAASLSGESVALRLIVVATPEEVEEVQRALEEGRDFSEVASELSVDDSKKNGGLVPFVVPQDRSPLARLAFQTPVGEVAGPLPISDHQFWIRIEERRAPLEGSWSVIEPSVEASLVKHPVGDAEFVNWKLVMEKRYPIDLGPLWSLVGAAR